MPYNHFIVGKIEWLQIPRIKSSQYDESCFQGKTSIFHTKSWSNYFIHICAVQSSRSNLLVYSLYSFFFGNIHILLYKVRHRTTTFALNYLSNIYSKWKTKNRWAQISQLSQSIICKVGFEGSGGQRRENHTRLIYSAVILGLWSSNISRCGCVSIKIQLRHHESSSSKN